MAANDVSILISRDAGQTFEQQTFAVRQPLSGVRCREWVCMCLYVFGCGWAGKPHLPIGVPIAHVFRSIAGMGT